MPDKTKDIFDPEGEGYDYESATAAGLGPDESGHWPTRVPKTGLILKGKKHPTYALAEDIDKLLGYNYILRNKRYYSLKKD